MVSVGLDPSLRPSIQENWLHPGEDRGLGTTTPRHALVDVESAVQGTARRSGCLSVGMAPARPRELTPPEIKFSRKHLVPATVPFAQALRSGMGPVSTGFAWVFSLEHGICSTLGRHGRQDRENFMVELDESPSPQQYTGSIEGGNLYTGNWRQRH